MESALVNLRKEPTVWNSLPPALRDSSLSLNTFQRRLKTHLFGVGQSWTPPGAVVAFLYDCGAEYKCHDLLTYLLYWRRLLCLAWHVTELSHTPRYDTGVKELATATPLLDNHARIADFSSSMGGNGDFEKKLSGPISLIYRPEILHTRRGRQYAQIRQRDLWNSSPGKFGAPLNFAFALRPMGRKISNQHYASLVWSIDLKFSTLVDGHNTHKRNGQIFEIRPLENLAPLWILRLHYGQWLSLIHIWRCRRSTLCRSRWSPYH